MGGCWSVTPSGSAEAARRSLADSLSNRSTLLAQFFRHRRHTEEEPAEQGEQQAASRHQRGDRLQDIPMLVQRIRCVDMATSLPTTEEARDVPADRGGVGALLRRPPTAADSRSFR